jgi:uncharacterized membrane protein YkvA (DUF1232 family)
MFKMFLPRLVLFHKEVVQLWKAFFAPETPLHLKAATLFVAFYLVNPLDIIPDLIPVLGWVDDLILVPLMVSWIVSRLPVPAHVYAGKHGRTVDGTARRL